MELPSLQDLQQAYDRVKPLVHRTPVLTCKAIDDIAGCEIYFKCENFQKVGAFKYRGGTNTILSLTEEEKRNGVATHSSGNHAQAVALAAKMQNIRAYIVMPSTAPSVKKNAVRGYGAQIIECEPTLQAREENLERVLQETGATMVHPYNDYRIILGQATAAMELFEEVSNLDYLLTPVGGGGLLSGSALAAHYLSPETKVIAGEPEGADDAYKSFQSGKLQPSVNPKSIADGLLTSLGEKPFGIIKELVDDIITVSEDEIKSAMKLVWERMKIVIEPSSAVPVAALLKSKSRFSKKHVAIIISGGNVDLEKISFS